MKPLLHLIPRKIQRSIHEHYIRWKGCSYASDGLITFHVADFLNDPRFREAYRLGKATGSWKSANIEWRVYVACWAATRGKALAGDFVECGVHKGGLARAVMHYIGFAGLHDRRFYLLDTFRGIPDEFRSLAAAGCAEAWGDCHDQVVRTFRDFANVIIIRGTVPDTLAQVPSEQVCYLSLDMNCAEPEIAAAEFFWDRLVPGAVVLLDDYGYSPAYHRQKEAFDAFARRRNVPILLLPTGQGLIVKP
jgi:O-methyltransferase